MKTHSLLAWLVSILLMSTAFSQSTKFRSGVFLHHSTGGLIWGPNGSTTSVPLEISAYNLQRGLTGQNAVSLTELEWPVAPDNEWERWHRIFENQDIAEADIRPILDTSRIVIIKSCFPSSQITDYGTPKDTLDPTLKTIWNYKWHWRSILKVMRQRPTNFFVIWTNAPLVAAATNDQQAILSDQFCRWAKDSLARGLDSQFGRFPTNVYVFDFFHKLAGADGKLPLKYAASSSDSHPNDLATQLVAPQFVSEVFNAALSYETVVSVENKGESVPLRFALSQNYPNPFNPSTNISFSVPSKAFVTLKVFDALGRQVSVLLAEELSAGTYSRHWDAVALPSGIYFYRLQAGEFLDTKRMVLLK